MENPPQLDAELGAPANPDHAPVEAGRRKAKQPPEVRVEDRGVVDDHLDATWRAQGEEVVEPIVGALELLEHLLLEAPRAAQTARLVDVHVLVEHEVGGGPLLEPSVRAVVRRRRARRRNEQDPRQQRGGASPADRRHPPVAWRSTAFQCSIRVFSPPQQPGVRPAGQAFALGRDDTASCQRERFFSSGSTRMSDTRPKSMAQSAVMSAIV